MVFPHKGVPENFLPWFFPRGRETGEAAAPRQQTAAAMLPPSGASIDRRREKGAGKHVFIGVVAAALSPDPRWLASPEEHR